MEIFARKATRSILMSTLQRLVLMFRTRQKECLLFKSCELGSNQRPQKLQSSALPIELLQVGISITRKHLQNTCGKLSLPSEDTAKSIFCYTLISIKILPYEGPEPPYFETNPNPITFGHQGFTV